MPGIRLSKEQVYDLLAHSNDSHRNSPAGVCKTDVLIAGSGPIACAYACQVIENHPTARVLMVEIGSQDHPIIGGHHKNSVKYQKDIDAFVHVIKGALQPISIPPGDTHQSTLAIDAWAPPINPNEGQQLVIQGHNPNQHPPMNLRASAVTRTVGGMATHWTCACPVPHEEEMINNPINKTEFNELLDRAKGLLNVHDDQFNNSIRHRVVKDTLLKAIGDKRLIINIPLGVERRKDNPEFVTWTGCDTILSNAVKSDRYTLWPETRATRLVPTFNKPREIGGMLVRNMRTNDDVLIIAKTYIIACGAICTPQILYNSGIRPDTLGCYLSEQSMAFCQIVLKRSIIESIADNPDFKKEVDGHKKAHPNDPLPIPFNDPEPQVMIPYSVEFPYHVQIHRDAFSYGDIGPKADPRVVVDLRFFGKSDIVPENKVVFGQNGPIPLPLPNWERPGDTDLYGMPQATFQVQRTRHDGKRDQKMMNDMTTIANTLGGFLPGSYPQYMEPGLALHITGTTRIGTDTKTSVADPWSKVHGFDNLWVGGNGCIPDSTASNPTLTSVAIAIKGAESVVNYLKENNI